jgi:hypothetical protein
MTPLLDAAAEAARRLGLFALAVPRTVDELAAAEGWGPRRLRALVDVLVAEGMLARDADGRVHGTGAAPTAASPPGAGLLVDVIRRDRPFDPARDGLSHRMDSQALAVAGLLSDATGEPKREVAERLAARLPPNGRFLDAGGGFGDVLDQLLVRAPTAQGVLVDRPDRVAVARTRLARHGKRAITIATELTRLPLHLDVDVALLDNVLHCNGPEACPAIVRAVAEAVVPNGEVWIKEPQLERDRSGPRTALLFALGAAVFTQDGDLHDDDTIAGWMSDAWLAAPRRERLTSASEAVLHVGRRP